tara:strand:+ start:100 stop:759 length:660 start_codon:yes stop_codon:yes gene_type:complete
MGEIIERAKVNAAISKTMAAVQTVGKDDLNQHGNYNFASIDGFLGGCRDACAANGLHPEISVISYEPFTGSNSKQWATYTYEVVMCHDSGEETKPVQTVVSLPITGAQTSGSAQSYALKQYLRGLFLIKTGEKDDPDFNAPIDLEIPAQPVAAPSKDYDLDEMEAKILSIKTLTALNAYISELNGLFVEMHKDNPSDYNRIYAFWKKQEKDIENGEKLS